MSCTPSFRKLAYLLLSIPVAANIVWGSAFSIAEQGAKASGMGTAYTAIADDGSAMYYNPAGIAFDSRSKSLLIANHALLSGNPAHFAILSAYVDNPGDPLSEP